MTTPHRATFEQWAAGEALYRFAAWLAARDQPLVISGHHDASPLADLLDQWMEKHGIEKPCPPAQPPIQNATTPHRATPEATQRILIEAGRIADLALELVGGRGLNGEIRPAHPDQFSEIARKLRRAVEAYNDTIITYSRHA